MGLYVYILKCSDRSFYVGVTNNIERRILIHNSGLNMGAYTFSRRPVSLEWSNYFPSNMEAINWEKKIKRWTRKKKQALIDNKFDLLHELSECKNETNYKISLRLSFDKRSTELTPKSQDKLLRLTGSSTILHQAQDKLSD